jgi:uncharacterized hydrophobic protein (TIGR00271 family)
MSAYARADDSEAQKIVRDSIADGARLDSAYLFMNALATVVASYGLLANSTAVVIGAMVVAMLLGPIMGLALALVDGDTRLLRHALVAELAGAVLVLALGVILGKVHSDIPLTSEILARTKPNLLDLMIALAGGAAGAYATVSPRLSVGLVGVAIATALVPPLASCGICISRGQYHLAGGAFLLFVTNLVAIQCASSVVLFAFGYHKVFTKDLSARAYIGRLVIDGLVLALLSIFLFSRLSSTIGQESFESSVRMKLIKGLEDYPGAYLAETRFRYEPTTDIVVAVVRVPNSITPQQTAKLQAALPTRNSRKIELHVRSLFTKEATAQGYLHVIEPKAQPVDELSVEGLSSSDPSINSSEP